MLLWPEYYGLPKMNVLNNKILASVIIHILIDIIWSYHLAKDFKKDDLSDFNKEEDAIIKLLLTKRDLKYVF